MPRNNVTGQYQLPAGTEAVAGTTILSAKFNMLARDIEADLNAPRPVSAGGTGQTTMAGIKASLDKRDYADFAALMADPATYPSGTVFFTRREGYAFEAVATGGSDTTTGGVMLQVAKRPRITPRAYGCWGDGSHDDHARLTIAISDARARGMILDGEGLTYRIGAPLTEIAGQVENLTIDASGITASIAWNMVGPDYEMVRSLTANALQGSRQLNATAHGYSVGDIILAQSDMVMETGTNSVCAHWAEVAATTTNTINLSHSLLCNLILANNARVQRLPRVDGVRLRNVAVIGSATCPGGIQMTRLVRPVVEGLRTRNCEVRGLSLVNCYMPRTADVIGDKCDRTGLGYAINVSGCGWADIGDTRGRRCRHVLTWGAGNAIPCVGGTYGNVIGNECLGSVFDTHPGAMNIWGMGSVIGDMTAEYAAQDAITMQAVGGSVRARITGTISRHLCLIQPFHNTAAFQTFPSVEADVEGDTTTGQGVSVDVLGSGGLRSASITVGGVHSGESVSVRVANGSVIGSVSINGNATSGVRGIVINQQASGQIGLVSLSGRFRTTNGGVVAAQVIGATDTGIPRTNINVAGLDASGGSYGLRVDNRADAKGTVSAFLVGITGPTFSSGGATIS